MVEAIEKMTGKNVPFIPGRGDASQEETDIESFNVLEYGCDGFRNYQKSEFSISPEEMLLDKAHQLDLSAPEMTVLLGGLRALGINREGYDCLTEKSEHLTNEFFVNLLDTKIEWKKIKSNKYQGINTSSGKSIGNVSRVDLIFGSNSQLRAIAEVYACDDGNEKFIDDFISAWVKVMNLDRFDLED